jgi:hypothetical protein
MNYRLHNQDLLVLRDCASRPRHGRTPGWRAVDWQPTSCGGNLIFLLGLSLLPNCSKERTDLKIEAPPDLYHPIGDRFVFYRNLWMDPDIEVFHPTRRRFVRLPRLHAPGADGLAFLCIHPNPVSHDKNVLWLLTVLDLFLTNPYYRATSEEAF